MYLFVFMAEDGAKAGKGQYFTSTCVKIPTCKQEPSTLNKESHTQYVENVDYGSTKFHPIEKGSSKVFSLHWNGKFEIYSGTDNVMVE